MFKIRKFLLVAVMLLSVVLVLGGCTGKDTAALEAELESLKAELAETKTVNAFDDFDSFDVKESTPFDGTWVAQDKLVAQKEQPTITFDGEKFTVVSYDLYFEDGSSTYRLLKFNKQLGSEAGELSDEMFRLMFLAAPLTRTNEGEFVSKVSDTSSWYKFSTSGEFSATDDMLEIVPSKDLPPASSKILILPYTLTKNTLIIDGVIFIRQ